MYYTVDFHAGSIYVDGGYACAIGSVYFSNLEAATKFADIKRRPHPDSCDCDDRVRLTESEKMPVWLELTKAPVWDHCPDDGIFPKNK